MPEPEINNPFETPEATVEQLELFCLHLSRGCTPGQAYVDAGMGKGKPCGDFANMCGMELLRDEAIRERVESFKVKQTPATKEWVLNELKTVYYRALSGKKYAAALKSLAMIGMEVGMFARPIATTGKYPRLGDMTNEELGAFIMEAEKYMNQQEMTVFKKGVVQ